MNDITRQRFAELKAGGLLPSPKGIALAVMNVSSQPNANAQDIARLVQADPAMAGRILRYANASNAGRMRHIVSLGQAVTFLGLFRVRQIVLGFSLLDQYRKGTCAAFDYTAYWESSLAAGIAAQKLAGRVQLPPDESFSCGLLASIGRLGFATAFPEPYSAILASKPDEAALTEAERDQFGIDHAHLSAEMLEGWGLPPLFTQAVRDHELPANDCSTPGTRAHALCTALNLAARIGRLLCLDETHRHSHVSELFSTAAVLGLVEEEVAELIAEVIEEWKAWAKDLKLPATFKLDIKELLSPQPQGLPEEGEDAARISELAVVLIIENEERCRVISELLAAMKLKMNVWRETETNPETSFDAGKTIVMLDAGNVRQTVIQQLQRLRQLAGGAVHVLVLIPDEDESEAMRLLEAGVADYLPYNFSAAALRVRLANARRLLSMQEEVRVDRELIAHSNDDWARANRRLLHEALTDPLTQLPNRRYGLDRFRQEWDIAVSNNLPIACLMLDIDHFKRVNDQHGHDSGDRVLRQLAAVVERCCRRSDFIFRYGGEEFCVICPMTAQAEAMLLGERITSAVRQYEFTLSAGMLHVTLSIGVAVRSPRMSESEQLIAKADEALYAAKNAGRDRVVSADE